MNIFLFLFHHQITKLQVKCGTQKVSLSDNVNDQLRVKNYKKGLKNQENNHESNLRGLNGKPH